LLGLLTGLFTINDIIKSMKLIEQDVNTKEVMTKVLDFLVYLAPQNSDH